jgi:predicted nucleic acid-binding protein
LPSSADQAEIALVDTSVAMAIVLADHEAHRTTLEAVAGRRLGLAGHAAFESYSVLTRLPPGARRSPAAARAILLHDFPATRFLDAAAQEQLLSDLPAAGVAGGSVYDALVGATARLHDLPLYSRDRRARSVYEALGTEVRFLS